MENFRDWNVHDVVAYILKTAGPVSTFKLHKLLYYCQGFSLAWDEHPLFDAKIEAWANGPVVPDVFPLHRGKFSVEEWPEGNADALDPEAQETVEAVVQHFKDVSGRAMAVQTHEEPPWQEARKDVDPGERSSAEISKESMQDYFAGIDAEYN